MPAEATQAGEVCPPPLHCFFRVALNITAVAEAELRRNVDGAPGTAVAETKLHYHLGARNNSTFSTVSSGSSGSARPKQLCMDGQDASVKADN